MNASAYRSGCREVVDAHSRAGALHTNTHAPAPRSSAALSPGRAAGGFTFPCLRCTTTFLRASPDYASGRERLLTGSYFPVLARSHTAASSKLGPCGPTGPRDARSRALRAGALREGPRAERPEGTIYFYNTSFSGETH